MGSVTKREGMKKARFVPVGSWRTLERFWGGKGRVVFLRPARAEIKVRYGNGGLARIPSTKNWMAYTRRS
jgi:hypothetical protein